MFVNAGVLLLEEENPFTAAYFVPFVHYVPFSIQNDLAFAIEFFVRNPQEADEIGRAAHEFCRDHYSSAMIWLKLIAAAYRDTSPAKSA